ncbi:zincin-like metallopeptidase domain-containing protein [Macrococcus capreoli]
MADNKFVRKTPAEKKKEIQETMNSALENVKNFTQDKNEIVEYLDFTAKFNKYSSRNIMLLHNQRQGSSAVASAKQWKDEHGLYIRKGQKSLRILAPVDYVVYNYGDKKLTFKELPKEMQDKAKGGGLNHLKDTKRGYKLVPVFDITQTTAKPEDYPKYYPNRPYDFEFNGEDLNVLKESLVKASQKFSVPVKDNQILEDASRGFYNVTENYIGLADNLTETEYIKVLAHEMAHSRLHHLNSEFQNASTNQKEIEAEMTAYVVSKHFGLNTDADSLPYIDSWSNHLTKNEKEIEILKNITTASSEIIDAAHREIDELKNIKEHSLNNSSQDEKYKLFIHFPDANNFQVEEIYNNKEWLNYNSDMILHKGTGQLLENQVETSFKDRSYLEMTEETILSPEDLKDLNKTIENEIGYIHRANCIFVLETEDYLKFTNQNGALGHFNFNTMSEVEKQFVDSSYEYFKKTGNEFFIDNVTDGKVMSMQEFMEINKDHIHLFAGQPDMTKQLSEHKDEIIKLDEKKIKKAIEYAQKELKPFNMSYEELNNDYAKLSGMREKEIDNVLQRNFEDKSKLEVDESYKVNEAYLDSKQNQEYQKILNHYNEKYNINAKEKALLNIGLYLEDNVSNLEKRAVMKELSKNTDNKSKEQNITKNYPYIEGLNENKVDNTINYNQLNDNYSFLTKHEQYKLHVDDHHSINISRKEFESFISKASPNEIGDIKDNFDDIVKSKDEKITEVLEKHNENKLTPAQKLTANNTMEMEIE